MLPKQKKNTKGVHWISCVGGETSDFGRNVSNNCSSLGRG
jgi:hypothetical protein